MRILPFLLFLQACAAAPPAPEYAPAEIASDEYDFQKALFPDAVPPRVFDILESLFDPVMVKGWTRDALLLAGDRTIPIMGAGDLRRHAILLSECTRNGIEIRDGTIIGLIRIWHWCGNDPVASHLARVDIADLLRYHSAEGVDDQVVAPEAFNSMWGWHVNAFHDFRDWQASRAPGKAPRAMFVVNKDPDSLVVFGDGRYRRASGTRDRMKVTHGRLPEELLRHLNYVVFEEAGACAGRPPFRMEGELADFVFDVLRRR